MHNKHTGMEVSEGLKHGAACGLAPPHATKGRSKRLLAVVFFRGPRPALLGPFRAAPFQMKISTSSTKKTTSYQRPKYRKISSTSDVRTGRGTPAGSPAKVRETRDRGTSVQGRTGIRERKERRGKGKAGQRKGEPG